MNDFFRQDQCDWWEDFVDSEVNEMRQASPATHQDIKDFDLDVPF